MILVIAEQRAGKLNRASWEAITAAQQLASQGSPGPSGPAVSVAVLGVHHQMAPPTINLDCPDQDCDLDYVPKVKRPMKIEYALSNSFGFGGTNAALLFKRFQG